MLNKEKFTIGEIAKYCNVSVRTLQYYDQIGLLKPSKLSETGRRIYLSKDITTLHQILTLKSLGFSLEDIKNNVIPVNDTYDVINLLDNQEEIIKNKIDKLQKILESVIVLKDEIEDKKEVDWYKYSNMVNLIQENSEYYWVVKHLDNKLIDHMHEQKAMEYDISPGWWRNIFERAIVLQKEGIDPKSEAGQQLADDWWNEMQKYSDGNIELLNKMIDFYNSSKKWPEEFREIQIKAQPFIEQAFLFYAEGNQIEILSSSS